MTSTTAWRAVSIGLGLVATGLGMFGAYEFARKLENGVSYLVIAAPVVAAAAALIPPIAEAMWRQGAYLKSLLWWLVLVPAAATVFYSAAERVHTSKAGAEAARGALRSAVERAQDDLKDAKALAQTARAEADKTLGWKTCKTTCLGKRERADRADAVVEKAQAALTEAEAKATTESPYKAPVWLLPAALDLIAFMAIWSGLTGPKPPQAPLPPKVKVKAKRTVRKRSKVVKPKAPPKLHVVTPVNDNSSNPLRAS